MQKYKVKISIIGTAASLFLLDAKGGAIDNLVWSDNRDLAEKILEKTDLLLKRNKILMKSISKFIFECDSPYYGKGFVKETKFPIGNLVSEVSSKGKCGFTSWQIGEITAKTFNFIIGKSHN